MTTKGNWVAGSHVKAELGQAQSMFRPSGAGACSRQSRPGPSSRFSLSLLRLRLLTPFQPYLAGHCPCPALHKLEGQSHHQSTGHLFGSKASPCKFSSSQLLPLLSVASQSVYALTQAISVQGIIFKEKQSLKASHEDRGETQD